MLERIPVGGYEPGATPVEMRSHERNVTQDTNSSQAQMFNDLLKNGALAAAYRTC
jgi:hypothetical protein